ncbi:MAG TPA: matrixin family metalloprotease [Chthoniobacterales bacterium]|nr:matrixin family metalloprotease [Chthoniobacterales bacterium]
MKIKPFLTFTALLLPFAILPSFGYVVTGQSWTRNRTVVMHLSLPPGAENFQDGFNSFGESAEDALNIWNQHLAHMRFTVVRNSILPPRSFDGDTSVSMSDTIYGDPFGNNVLAVTLVTSRGSTMFEADVIFNDAYAYDSYRGNLQPGVQDFHRIALHEFGHVLGLGHPNQGPPPQTVTAIMNSQIGNVDSLRTDDVSGAQSIYSSGPPYLNSNPSSNLVNLSTRAFVSTGENALIGGFIVQGSQPATVILRAIGHSLRASGIGSPLTDPVMELHGSSGMIATSDDWIDSSNATTIASYRLDPSNSLESAIIATLNPGNYTVVVRAYDTPGDLTGVGLVELYDLHTTNGRAGNISTRAQVLFGENVMIGGFIVGGSQSKEVVVRGIGPSLGPLGIANPLGDPTLELYNGTGTLISSNNDWQAGPDAAAIQARGLAPTHQAESALLATLNPGNHTAIVRGFNNTAGVALVEAYDLSPPP